MSALNKKLFLTMLRNGGIGFMVLPVIFGGSIMLIAVYSNAMGESLITGGQPLSGILTVGYQISSDEVRELKNLEAASSSFFKLVLDGSFFMAAFSVLGTFLSKKKLNKVS